MTDRSEGYEAVAEHFVRARTRTIGPTVVWEWAQGLPGGAAVLDLGCGFGIPITETLIRAGLTVYGIDASPSLLDKFRERFPNAPTECSAVQDSSFFCRTFDGVVAWGLMFLLPAEDQRELIGKIARTMNRRAQLLFTSPRQAHSWTDVLTGRVSVSLGHEAYESELVKHDLELVGNAEDEGENYYYFARKL